MNLCNTEAASEEGFRCIYLHSLMQDMNAFNLQLQMNKLHLYKLHNAV